MSDIVSPHIAPTRREVRRHFRRESILDVAASSFLEHGYAGTTMSAIAAELGGSKATLWGYFESKEVLFAAVLDRLTYEFRAQLSVFLTPDDGLEVALSRFCRQYLMLVTSPQATALYRLVIGEAGRNPEVGRMFYDRGPKQTHQLLGSFLAAAMERGELRQADPTRAAQILMGLCMSGSHQQVMFGMFEEAPLELIDADVEQAMISFMGTYAPGQG